MAVLVLVLVALAGCSASADSTVGSLGTRTLIGTVCVETRGQSQFLIGWETLLNSGHAVTIDAVTLTEPHNLTLDQALLSRLDQFQATHLLGISRGVHPRFSPTDEAILAALQPAVGASIAKGENVGLVLRLSSSGGWSGPPRVSYTDASGGAHTWVGGSSMSIRSRSCSNE